MKSPEFLSVSCDSAPAPIVASEVCGFLWLINDFVRPILKRPLDVDIDIRIRRELPWPLIHGNGNGFEHNRIREASMMDDRH
jgi:hypothetical protein